MGMERGSFSAVDQPRRTLTSRMNSKDDKDGHRGNAILGEHMGKRNRWAVDDARMFP